MLSWEILPASNKVRVGLPYLVEAHKAPLRNRSNGRGRLEDGREAPCSVF